MGLASGLAIYFILWWLTLFTVLPWGVRSPEEAGESVAAGHAASAPVNPMIGRKIIATTLLSGVIFGVVYWLRVNGHVGLDDIPFLPKFRAL